MEEDACGNEGSIVLAKAKSEVAFSMNKRLLFFLAVSGSHLSADDALGTSMSRSQCSEVCGFDAYDYAVDSGGRDSVNRSLALRSIPRRNNLMCSPGRIRRLTSWPPISSHQLDPPAHWAPEYPAIDEIPATFAVRPLVVISIVEKLKKDDNYHLQVADIENWEGSTGDSVGVRGVCSI
jgi:hypothetical protein